MKIHTSDPFGVARAIYAATAPLPGVYADTDVVGSRSHNGAVNLKLEGTSNRRQNAGTSRSVDRFDMPHAATWDEWGVVLAAVFATDPKAIAGSVKHPIYKGAEHYHTVTGDRFREGLPEDTHQNHRWDYSPERLTRSCTHNGCSATYTPVPA